MDRIEIGRGDFKTAVVAKDKQTLTDLLGEIKNKNGGDGYFEITMPCKTSQVFRKYSDIPSEDLPCSCGQEGEYLIRYEREDNNGHKTEVPTL